MSQRKVIQPPAVREKLTYSFGRTLFFVIIDETSS